MQFILFYEFFSVIPESLGEAITFRTTKAQVESGIVLMTVLAR